MRRARWRLLHRIVHRARGPCKSPLWNTGIIVGAQHREHWHCRTAASSLRSHQRQTGKEAAIEHLHALAAALGVARIWWDVDGQEQTVADEALALIVTALGYPAHSEADAQRSLDQVAEERRQPPHMIVTDVGRPTPLPASLTRVILTGEDGHTRSLTPEGWMLPPVDEPGYYQLEIGGHHLTLAVAPPACPAITSFTNHRMWGPAVQIPALRGAAPNAFGDFADLDAATALFASRGADALAINPVHALFPGNGIGFSPYSPSSRLFLNGAMGNPALLGLPPLPEREGGVLIDWEHALPQRLADLRAAYSALDVETRTRIAGDSAAQGETLYRQAIFDALDVHFRAEGADGWRQWPEPYRNPDGPAVQDFARQHAAEVEFHLFTQWLARESLAAVQDRATQSGMAIGLIADLAVGVHTGGADSWSLRDVMLEGLTIGAPPDKLGPHGQNWALTSFSPGGLIRSAFAPWIEMLRAALGRAGGLRIDHAFGLARLWVVPEHHDSRDGAYLSYPFHDMLRLLSLEASRANALIIAEDLGTMPHGFGEAIAERHLAGMRVLWFERAKDHGFIGPQDYAPETVSMTGTHDTATVAGWWSGRDLDWAEDLGRLGADVDRAEADRIRDWDRGLLWSTIGGNTPRPAPEEPAAVAEAALAHIGHARSHLAIAPLEDILALQEQPNLPGTITEHPNWRRRIDAPLGDLMADPATSHRVDILSQARRDADAAG